jgi:hypothetical protein
MIHIRLKPEGAANVFPTNGEIRYAMFSNDETPLGKGYASIACLKTKATRTTRLSEHI